MKEKLAKMAYLIRRHAGQLLYGVEHLPLPQQIGGVAPIAHDDRADDDALLVVRRRAEDQAEIAIVDVSAVPPAGLTGTIQMRNPRVAAAAIRAKAAAFANAARVAVDGKYLCSYDACEMGQTGFQHCRLSFVFGPACFIRYTRLFHALPAYQRALTVQPNIPAHADIQPHAAGGFEAIGTIEFR
ncbi:hypothetical protein SDC9_118679 [bioreactor metagenome]|uniref:Uncharacterized protein n=1 Tax=bioreactor metagenome TaxID=1076179 RepID=A0A645C266_9ZZZZ